MAEAGLLLDRNQLNCSVCLDVLKDPVTIPCGHSYCRDCITDYWDQNQNRAAVCPQCRNTFSPRPNLCRNTEVLQKLQEAASTRKETARLPELCDSTDRTRDAMNPGKCSLAQRSRSANTHIVQTCGVITY
uniref:RING-type domain-containing protein n=1 Tax=Gouania willdenowi TaxID=441366 RepID=A0A8C5EPN5_GOUWI